MADELPNQNSYNLLGGINQKASKYRMATAQFLDLRNLDFDVPNALQKRPGSTFAIVDGGNLSGPVIGLTEFQKLLSNPQVPSDFLVAATNQALWYNTPFSFSNPYAYSLLDTGWTSGQPPSMLTFVDKLWIADGTKWKTFNAGTITPVGLPLEKSAFSNIVDGTKYYLTNATHVNNTNGNATTYMLVGGATHVFRGASISPVGVYVAYSYVRNDGYYGPADFLATAQNVVMQRVNEGQEYFTGTGADGVTYRSLIGGFTLPASSYGVSAIALWVAVDRVTPTSTMQNIPGVGSVLTGNLGWQDLHAALGYMSVTLKPGADLSRFRLFTLIPAASLFNADMGDPNTGSYIVKASTFIPVYNDLTGVAPATYGWSGMTSDFFATYAPKYLDTNQNTMFISGFSSAPSTVKFSELGDPEVYMPENTFEVRTNDGDRIYMQKAFNNQVIFAKEHSFSKLIGGNADNYELVDLSTDFGCLSDNTCVSKEQTLYWLDRKGILEYNGASWRIVSDPVEGIFRRMNISAAKEKAVGVHHMYRNQLWWGIPVDGSTENNITVVFDYLVGAWTFFDGYNPASYAYLQGALSKPTVWRGDYSGMIHYTGESFFSDSGRGITCLAFTQFQNIGGENQTTLWRRMFLDVAPATGLTGVINGQLFANYNTTSVQATFAMYQDQFQSRAEFGVQGKAIAGQFSHASASLPLLINGYTWADRKLRNV